MAQCAQCLFDNADGAAACEQCGAELAVEALSMQLGEVCRSCDSYNDPGVRRCVSCGAALGNASEPPPVGEPDEDVPLDEPAEAPPAAPSQPWMAPPAATANTSVPPPSRPPAMPAPAPAAPVASMAAPAPTKGGSPAPLPPGALPPGWAAFQQKAPPARSMPGPAGSHACVKCGSENPASARFCGSCGFALTPAADAPKAKAKLILIRGISGEGRQFPLGGATNSVGRTEGTVAFPEDPYVAGLHATFYFKGEDLLVKDEGAGNGIYVRLREAQPLRPGDMFVVGERLLRFAGPASAGALTAMRHGSPRTADRLLVLEEILEGGGVGRICRRAGPIVTIGRAGCDLNFPADGFVSARHAEVSVAGETAFLRDLGSANGTFLRVQPKAERKLNHGDYLLMGRELLRVEVSAAR